MAAGALVSLLFAGQVQADPNYVGPIGGLWSVANNWRDTFTMQPVVPKNSDSIFLDQAAGTMTNDDIGSLFLTDVRFGIGTNVVTINSGNALAIVGNISVRTNMFGTGSALFQVQNAGSTLVLQSFGSDNAEAAEVDVSTGGTLDVSTLNRSQSIGALGGGSGGNVLVGANTLTVGALNTNTTFGGTISGNGGSLTKIGTGTQELTHASTYSGATNIQAGVLSILDSAALGTSAVTIGQSGGGNATLRITPTIGTVANNIMVAAVASGSTATIDARTASPATVVFTGSMTLNGSLSLMSAAPLNNPLTISGQITGSGALNLNSTNTAFADAVQLTNSSNNYTGGTNVSAGTLFVNNTSGSATGTNTVSVGSSASISGNGFITGPLGINAGGTLAPGFNGAGIFHIGSGGLFLSGTLSLEIGGLVAGSGYDQVQTAGGATIAGQLSIAIVNNFQPMLGSHFYILDNTSLDPTKTTTGAFSNGGTVTDNRGNVYAIIFGDTDPNKPSGLAGRDIGLVAVSIVPEPTTCALCLTGLISLASMRRRASSR